ncbi:MAG: YbhB/YbcL family Raf kinase inhibitor-like protein [Candidatus Pacearchaeota archaeon]
MEIKSEVFENHENMPSKHTCDEENISPPLKILSAPEDTKSFVLICEDPDLPKEVIESMGINVFDHWVSFNILSEKTEIAEGEEPGIRGKNSAGAKGYAGPCPPKEYEPTKHRYIFKVYALDTKLDLEEGSSKDEVKEAMKGHILDSAELVGKYEKQ